ncbi:MAG: glycosyltransferase family 39 protein [Candidatus Levybacteria bacterium]|nr:glycosyltransferase family 39 protein [Candidatus Levybacteria bacterium]
MDLFYSLLNNINQNFSYLKEDFVGLNIDLSVFLGFFINFLFSLILIFISFALGKKIINLFTKKSDNASYSYLIYIAIGYIAIGTLIAVLGIFSLLSKTNILIVFGIIVLITNPFSFKKDWHLLHKSIKSSFSILKRDKFVFIGVSLFILLSLVNLINPEIREDQYHVDLPRIYLQNQTIMIPPKEDLHVSGSTLLAEMFYTPTIVFTSKESARFVHFIFYFLTLFTLLEFSRLKDYKFAVFTPLIFVTAPVVLHEASSMYVDFQWIFLFLLSVLILIANNKKARSVLILSGFLLGGMLATKLWTIVFIPLVIAYLLFKLKRERIYNKFINIVLFGFATLIVPSIWFIRSFILTGNFVYPAFTKEILLDGSSWNLPLSHYLVINSTLLNPLSLINVFSPFFFLGLIFILYGFKNNFSLLLKLDIFKLSFMFLILYLVLNYPYGRYLLGLYVLFIFIASLGLNNALRRFKYLNGLLLAVLLVFFSYYFINSLLILPYALGIADKNSYLSRVLVRDNSSYYDFGRSFDKYIDKQDLVAMYNFHGYYYADFKYIDTNYIFDNENRNFDLLRKNGITKLLTRGGDIEWFCQKIKLSNCVPQKYSLISNYSVHPYYYLYNIK